MGFFEKYEQLKKEKKSVLCAGLDPASPQFRQGMIPEKYFQAKSEVQGIYAFCEDVVEAVGESALAVKTNLQYAFPFSLEQFQFLNKKIHEKKMLSICDLKLSDIGSTNKASCYWLEKAGFDAFTASPFPGNVEETIKYAHARNLGVFMLCLMTNPTANVFMKSKTGDNGKTGFEWIAEETKKAGGDGLVVGATKEAKDMKKIREIAGEKNIFLIPGVGTQGGDVKTVLENAGKNVLINVSRELLKAENIKQKAKEYKEAFNAQ
ncbi:orotidine-5'-phosphate decarboxylase [Candidatus Micrarchaeota archaeon]|nr:orotidine-5'-phosphate decarboxylase [Candidatus Micrarchaeota archaeon]